MKKMLAAVLLMTAGAMTLPAFAAETPKAETPKAEATKADATKKDAAKQKEAAQPAVDTAGKVWVNGKVYHCEGTQHFGKTKKGEYMTEADAKAKGARGAGGKECAKK